MRYFIVCACLKPIKKPGLNLFVDLQLESAFFPKLNSLINLFKNSCDYECLVSIVNIQELSKDDYDDYIDE